jgi:membrane protease YdiL (CAAX protease family)
MTSVEASSPELPPGLWWRFPVIVRSVVVGFIVSLPAANVIPTIALGIGPASTPTTQTVAGLAGIVFLTAFLWWTRGGGWPRSTSAARARATRVGPFSGRQWILSFGAALAFAILVHAALVVLFRIVPFPTDAFHRGYDLSNVPSLPLKWLVIVFAAASAAITEETGFRGYMQQPIEVRHGAFVAIVVSSVFFLVAHFNQSWAIPAMFLIIILAGVLLGLLAWSSGSLIPGILGHTMMDIGLFAYWWTGLVGTFSAKTISETGIDAPFVAACAVFGVALIVVLVAIARFRQLRRAR